MLYLLSSWSRATAISVLTIPTMLALSAVSVQAEASCDGLVSAMLANAKTPYRSISIITFDSGDDPKPAISQTSETIATGDAVFVRFGSGKWKQIHIPPEKLAEAVRQNAESFSGCKRLDDETVDGKTLTVYTGHSLTPKSVVETKIWVEPERGVLIRSETDIAPTPEPGDVLKGRHVAIRYNYENIAPPAADQ